mmetsp:Transcript_7026/g.12895  ORF Transcript_7026/g.12895 Transcript_7026/m.12895 type:complete len:110 (-) Transcript_7026:1656-1985(-)
MSPVRLFFCSPRCKRFLTLIHCIGMVSTNRLSLSLRSFNSNKFPSSEGITPDSWFEKKSQPIHNVGEPSKLSGYCATQTVIRKRQNSLEGCQTSNLGAYSPAQHILAES